MSIQAVILAAGKGSRMHSNIPKVMHRIANKPLLGYVLDTVYSVLPEAQPILVYGYLGNQLREAFQHDPIQWVFQKELLGTGRAVEATFPFLNASHVLILYGDVPFISKTTLQKLIDETPLDAIGMLTANCMDPKGHGRIKRDVFGHVIEIIEEKDADANELLINEINPGIYLIPADYLKKCLPKLKNDNAQKEYYLTDIIKMAFQEKILIKDIPVNSFEEVMGVNDHLQLAFLERFYQKQQAENLMRQGVTLIDPNRFDLRGKLQVGRDVTIDVNVILEGGVYIGDHCYIGPHSILKNVTLGNHVTIKSHCNIDGASISDQCTIGPFARIRLHTMLAASAHIGNFVEIKNSCIGEQSKINHLSYIGDTDIGACVNVGAGTITCNYDGANKHRTVIEDDVHIGSDTQLIAPIIVGKGATIAAGSTITQDVPPHGLTLSHRLEQRNMADWIRPEKEPGII